MELPRLDPAGGSDFLTEKLVLFAVEDKAQSE
jgi:hypothetical protein